jgi:hypothetical protein
MQITPTPTDEEAAAIVTAIEMSWPRASDDDAAGGPPRWRFSGRWWAKPVPSARRRP